MSYQPAAVQILGRVYTALCHMVAFHKNNVFLKFSTICVFTGWRIGTFYKVEIDKVIIS